MCPDSVCMTLLYGYCGWWYVFGSGIDTLSSFGLASSDRLDSCGCVAIGILTTLCASLLLYRLIQNQ